MVEIADSGGRRRASFHGPGWARDPGSVEAGAPSPSASHWVRMTKRIPLCDRDMGALARSLVEPGLEGRVEEYWNSVRAAAQAQREAEH